jgi:hypothetical protein
MASSSRPGSDRGARCHDQRRSRHTRVGHHRRQAGRGSGAKIIAIKACSAPATSCSGIALLEAMDFALDPNQDGRIRDRVDIINMSLGSPYGQALRR